MPFTLPNRLPKSDLDPAAPICGKCGYCVRGISELTCPECGSDLREVGIFPANQKRLASRSLKLIAWSIAFPLLAVGLSLLLLYTVLPFSQMYKVDRNIQINTAAFKTTLMIFASERPWQPALMGRPNISPQTFSVWDRLFMHDLEFKPLTGEFSSQSFANPTSPLQGKNLTGKALSDCFLPPTANPADPQLKDLFDSLSSVIIDTSKGINTSKVIPLLDRNGVQIGTAQPIISFVVHDEPSPILIIVLTFVWLAIWIYGFRRIFR
jgi:hypothetical protein